MCRYWPLIKVKRKRLQLWFDAENLIIIITTIIITIINIPKPSKSLLSIQTYITGVTSTPTTYTCVPLLYETHPDRTKRALILSVCP